MTVLNGGSPELTKSPEPMRIGSPWTRDRSIGNAVLGQMGRAMGRLSGDCDNGGMTDERSHSPERGGDQIARRNRDFSNDRLIQLTRTIEAEIIPRLLLANSAAQCTAEVSIARSTVEPNYADVEALAGLAIRHEVTAAMAFIDTLRARGSSLDDIFLKLLAPAARHLGELWEADVRDFAEVTMGLATLQQILRALSPSFSGDVDAVAPGHSVLLIPARGETHTFGVHMLEQFFRRAGWDVDIGLSGEHVEFARLVARKHIDIVGFSLSCETGLADLAADIKVMRRKSVNRAIGVMVGGPAFLNHPERVAQVGADGTGADGPLAVTAANKFVLAKTKHKT